MVWPARGAGECLRKVSPKIEGVGWKVNSTVRSEFVCRSNVLSVPGVGKESLCVGRGIGKVVLVVMGGPARAIPEVRGSRGMGGEVGGRVGGGKRRLGGSGRSGSVLSLREALLPALTRFVLWSGSPHF